MAYRTSNTRGRKCILPKTSQDKGNNIEKPRGAYRVSLCSSISRHLAKQICWLKPTDLPNSAEIRRTLPNMLKLAENRRRLPKERNTVHPKTALSARNTALVDGAVQEVSLVQNEAFYGLRHPSSVRVLVRGVKLPLQLIVFKGAGSPAWIRTTIHGSKGRCPTVRRPGNSGGDVLLSV